MKSKKLYYITLTFCFLLAFALSIKSFREPDLWWQIRTGEWILKNHMVPVRDVFSYTMKGTEWINIKWGFEVLAAIVTGITGIESVFIIQALVSLLFVYFLLRITKIFFGNKDFNVYAFALTLVITLIGIEYRMIGRPEMFSHLFSIVFLYLLLLYRTESSRKIFLLIPLQMIWANMHEAYGTGVVITSLFVFAIWFEYFQDKKNKSEDKRKKAVTLSVVLLASVAGICVNPYGTKLLLRPLNILSQVYENKFTTELHSVNSSAYWEKEAFIGLVILIISVYSFFVLTRSKVKVNIVERLNVIGVGYILTWLAFLYLALTAYRNIVFFILVSFPFLYFFLKNMIVKLNNKIRAIDNYFPIAVCVLVFTFYVLVVSNVYYKMTTGRNRFGLEVLSASNAVNAANFIEQNGLKDKKCFSDYLISSCLLWKLQPEFQTFIDLRDFDVFPKEFFDRFLICANYPDEFHKLDNIQKFDYVVLYRPQFKELHSYLYNDSVYACVYVDPVAAVYRKTDSFTRDDIFSKSKPVSISSFSSIVNHILNPFYEKYNYANFNYDYAASEYYLDVNQFELAGKRAENIVSSGKEKDKGFEMLGNICFEQSLHVKDSAASNSFLIQAGNYFSESIHENHGNLNSQLGLGHILLVRKNYKTALEKFEMCIDLDSKNYDAHVMSAECCKMLITLQPGRAEELKKKLLNHFLSAESINPGNPYIIFNIGFAYFKLNNCDKAVNYLERILNDPNLSVENRSVAKKCVEQCNSH